MIHELEHVRRGDWLSQYMARIVGRVLVPSARVDRLEAFESRGRAGMRRCSPSTE